MTRTTLLLPDNVSNNVHESWFYNEVGFMPNNDRFEGFKSSGKIGDIDDTELQNDILDLYQENVSSLIRAQLFLLSERESWLITLLKI